MGRGKVRVFTKFSQAKYHCPNCDYIATGEKQKELHFKYSHGLKYDGKERNIAPRCISCSKKIKECTCTKNGRRQ